MMSERLEAISASAPPRAAQTKSLSRNWLVQRSRVVVGAVVFFAASHAHAETLVGRFGWTGSAWTVDATNSNNAGFNNPGTNDGDLALNTGGTPLQFASGFTMATLAENDPTGTNTFDNILAPFPDATTSDLFISEVDNNGTEESSPLSVALFPYADGWSGAAFQANGTRVNGDTGISVSKTATGTYSVTGVPTTGNLVAIATGNGATNVAAVTNTGSAWQVLTIGSGGTAADADFQLMHIPTAATGVATGVVDWDTLTVTGLNTGTTGQIAADSTAGYMQLQVNGGALDPSNSLLFLWAEGADATSIDNIYSTDYDPGSASNGNDWWEIAGVDLPGGTTVQESDFRFLVVPLNTSAVAVPEPSTLATITAGLVSLSVCGYVRRRRRKRADSRSIGRDVRERESLKTNPLALLALVWAVLAVKPLPAADLMYVAMRNNNAIVTYDISLSTSAAIAASASTFANTNLDRPRGLAFDSSGSLYVASERSNSISIFDSSGGFVASITTNLNRPRGLAFDSSGNLYAVNVLDNSISKFDSSGGFLSSITTNLSNPEALAFDSSGNLYASNFNTSSISKFDSSGTFLSTISSTGNLWDPRGLAFDSSGNLYASDTDDLIKKFDSSGTFLSTIGTGNLNAPWGVVFDSSGNLYASNVGDNSISKFDSAGNFVFSWSLADTPSFMAFGPAPVPVPEPSNWILGTIATATFGFMARRNRMIRKA